MPEKKTLDQLRLEKERAEVRLAQEQRRLTRLENRKRLNEAVKRNIARFPEEFRFQLTEKETESLRSQIATSMESNGNNEKKGGRRYLPYAFTEQGIAMLSAVLRSDVAIQVSINIMNAFVEMRRFIANNALLFERISTVELKQLEYQKKLMKSLSRYLST